MNNSTITVDSYGTIQYKNEKGLLHREDGPAVEFLDGDNWYYLNGINYSKNEWEKEILKLKIIRIKDL